MSYESLKEYLTENPHMTQVVCAPAVISGISGVTHKNDSGFNDMLSRIAAANPHSPLADSHGARDAKSAKTRAAVKKAKGMPT